MSVSRTVHWTTADLELLPDNGNRYEIIDGELFVTSSPHWEHQRTCGRIFSALDTWSQSTDLGQAAINPGIIFTDADNVIPDVVWASNERLAVLLDDAGHLTAAPELIVEVLSPGVENERRDREVKLPVLPALWRKYLLRNRGGGGNVQYQIGAITPFRFGLPPSRADHPIVSSRNR